MNETRAVNSIHEYFKALTDSGFLSAPAQAHTVFQSVFRGEKRNYTETKCLSLVGRQAVKDKTKKINEKWLLDNWSYESELADEQKYPDSEWERLMWARHHGLITRITDWTTNPLTALWFSCEDAHEAGAEDGYIYMQSTMGISRSDFIQSSPFLNNNERYEVKPRTANQANNYSYDNLFITPPYKFHKRLKRQSGVFHVAADIKKSALDYPQNNLVLRIASESKKDIIADLDCCNVTAESLGLNTPDNIAERFNKSV